MSLRLQPLTPEVRSKRRFLELEAEGQDTTPEEVHRLMLERDHNDRNRQLAPLKPADDAILVDSSDLQIEEVVELMLDRVEAMSKGLSG
ncbi:MAG: (d)CMP kinase [Deltaproteobacteria bacterium]